MEPTARLARRIGKDSDADLELVVAGLAHEDWPARLDDDLGSNGAGA